MLKKFISGVLFAILASGASAQTSLGTANSFNVFVFGNGSATGGGEAEGAVAAGGSLTLSSFNTTTNSNEWGSISGLMKADGSFGTLGNISIYAGGAFNYSSVNVNNGGDAFVHGKLTAGNPSNFNGGGKLYEDAGAGQSGIYPSGYNYAVDTSVFSNQKNFSVAQSASLAANAASVHAGFTVVDQNSWTFDAYSQQGSLKYLTVSAATLNSLQGTNLNLLNLKDTDTLVINVTGDRVSQTFFSLVNQSHNGYYANVLWNFASTSATAEFDISQRAFYGSLLAPNAFIDQNNVFEGNLIANSWTDHGYETHLRDNFKFSGSLGEASFHASASTPEGDSLALMLGGLLPLTGAGLWKHRRRKSQN